MILVDTSVLIDYLRGEDNKATEKLQYILDTNIPFGISPLVYQETLQGAQNEGEFRVLKNYLGTQRFYPLKNMPQSYEQAAEIYFRCRKQGITLCSTIDCLIAQTAIEHDLYLLHRDRDFEKMAKIVRLKFF